MDELQRQKMIQELERKIAGLASRVYLQEDDQRQDALLPPVDGGREEAQPVSPGRRTGAAAGADRTAQSILQAQLKELRSRRCQKCVSPSWILKPA